MIEAVQDRVVRAEVKGDALAEADKDGGGDKARGRASAVLELVAGGVAHALAEVPHEVLRQPRHSTIQLQHARRGMLHLLEPENVRSNA